MESARLRWRLETVWSARWRMEGRTVMLRKEGRFLAMLLLGLLIGGSGPGVQAGGAEDGVTVVYLFRHAETVPPPYTESPPDPHLRELGLSRASRLADVLGDAGVTAIFSTDLNRTRETVGPLMERLDLPLRIYDGRSLGELAETIRSMSGRIAVSGHSNTTPELVRLLGGEPGDPVDESTEFDRLYVVIFGPDMVTTSMLLRY